MPATITSGARRPVTRELPDAHPRLIAALSAARALFPRFAQMPAGRQRDDQLRAGPLSARLASQDFQGRSDRDRRRSPRRPRCAVAHQHPASWRSGPRAVRPFVFCGDAVDHGNPAQAGDGLSTDVDEPGLDGKGAARPFRRDLGGRGTGGMAASAVRRTAALRSGGGGLPQIDDRSMRVKNSQHPTPKSQGEPIERAG